MSKYVVAVQRGKNVAEMVQNCLQDLGGVKHLVPAGKSILVKPNLVVEKPHSSGAITNPLLLDALLEELAKSSPRELIVGEGAATDESTTKAFRVSGVERIAAKHGARLVDFQRDTYIDVPVPRGRDLHQVEVAKTVLQADFIVNVPVLKIHCQTRATNALKNLKGCISDREKRRFHSRDLEQCIADLNTVLPVDLVVVDATLCAFSWEGGGEPVQLDTVMATTNQVAADMVSVPLLGYQPGEIRHLVLAVEHGLGPIKREEIAVLQEEQLKDIKVPNPGIKLPRYAVSGMKVVDQGACTSCMGAILAAQRRLKGEGAVVPAKVLLGQKLEAAQGDQEKVKVLGIGRCGASIVGVGNSLPGCPPEGWQVYEFLRKHARR